jgi:hypothetical protein
MTLGRYLLRIMEGNANTRRKRPDPPAVQSTGRDFPTDARWSKATDGHL